MKQTSVLFCAVLALAILFACGKTSDQQTGENPPSGGLTQPEKIDIPEPNRPAKKFALLVGINRYKFPNKVSPLEGCVNDVEDMKALLIGKFGFEPENIKVLINDEATHQGIIDAFKSHLIAQAQRDDIVVFHYSGHGSMMRDEENGDEADGWDETIVPYDSRGEDVFDINDDQLNGLLRGLSLKCKNISFIFDSCHSGTATRGSGLRRYVKPDLRTPPPNPDFALKQRGVTEGKNDMHPANLNYVLLSGCLAKQTAFEHLDENNNERGAFTYFFTNEIRKAGNHVTYKDIMDRVRGKVQMYYANQEPQFEGTQLDQFVFSDSGSIAEPYFLAQPKGRTRVKLNAGKVQGLTVGSTVGVFSPGTKKFDDMSKAVAQVKLSKVDAFSAEGKIISGKQVEKNARAVVAEQNYPDIKLRVYYKGLSNSPTLQQLKSRLDKLSYIQAQPGESGYHILLAERDGNIIWEGGDGSEMSPPIPLTEEDVLARLVNRMTAWAKWFNTLSIENPSSAGNIKFEIETKGEDGASRSVFANIDNPDEILKDGQHFTCRITNEGDKKMYISVLVLSNDGKVDVLYPDSEGAKERLKKGSSITLENLEAYLPEGKNSSTDVFKVFATRAPVDFNALASPPIKGVDENNLEDPLSQLLGQAMQDVSRDVRRAINPQDWETTMRVVRVIR